jgi:basic membrane protein A and related proteins
VLSVASPQLSHDHPDDHQDEFSVPDNTYRRTRRSLLIAAMVAVTTAGALTGCTKSASKDTKATSSEATSEASGSAPASDATGTEAAVGGGALKGKKVVYLINGALGDKGFYDSGQEGIKKLEEKYGVTTSTLEGNFDAAKNQALVDAAFEEGDVIFAISYGFEDALKAAAKAHPDKPVINIDFDIKDADKNISSVDFIEEQSAYLAGVTAALVTTQTAIKGVNKDSKIGVVLGDKDPVSSSFAFAYANGAKSINTNIVVETKDLGGAWDDQAKGKQAAEQLYDAGSDIVFQVAAAAGLGVLQSAKDRGLYAIGVDSNQNDLQPGHIVASDIKNVGGSIEKVAATIDNGTYKPGTVLTYGLAEGGVDLDLTATTPVLDDAITLKVREVRDQIISGELKVARYVAK